MPGSPLPPMQRPAALLVLMLLSVGGLAITHPAAVTAQEPDYPSEELLRRLQLETIACGRDNRNRHDTYYRGDDHDDRRGRGNRGHGRGN